MKKTLRLLLSTTVLAALIAGMQITAFAATVSSRMDATGRQNTTSAVSGTDRTATDRTAVGRAATGRATEAEDTSRLDETNTTSSDNLNDVSNTENATGNTNQATANEINPISAVNPRTGSGGLAIPAAVALLAASTAAVVLTAKKR